MKKDFLSKEEKEEMHDYGYISENTTVVIKKGKVAGIKLEYLQ